MWNKIRIDFWTNLSNTLAKIHGLHFTSILLDCLVLSLGHLLSFDLKYTIKISQRLYESLQGVLGFWGFGYDKSVQWVVGVEKILKINLGLVHWHPSLLRIFGFSAMYT